jgi:hypothetical protein
MTADDLQAVLDRGDADACLALFEKATEKERKAVANARRRPSGNHHPATVGVP